MISIFPSVAIIWSALTRRPEDSVVSTWLKVIGGPARLVLTEVRLVPTEVRLVPTEVRLVPTEVRLVTTEVKR